MREQRKTAVRLRSITDCHSSRESSTAGLRAARPALLTRMSMPPCCFSASTSERATAFSSVTSQPVAISRLMAVPPAFWIRRTVAAPMPFAPPVTMATLPCSRNSSIGKVYSVSVHDLLIRNALLLDGLGSAPVRGNLAVKDGRITGVAGVEGSAKETIDADGLALMPGIIDNHTHYDAQITWDPHVSPSPSLGVTPAVLGNCGLTIAPCRSGDRDRVMRNLAQVEGMSLEVLKRG